MPRGPCKLCPRVLRCPARERASGDIGVGCYDPGVDLDWTLPATALASVTDSPAFKTGERALSPGHAGQSGVIQRMSGRNTSNLWPSMPPVGTEVVDGDGVALLSAWIDGP